VDLVHANDPTNARAVIVAARSLGIPVVAYVHFPPGTGFFRWCFRFLPRPEAFAYCSHSLWHDLEAEVTAACPSSLNIVVHNSIPLEEFPKADGPRPGGGRLRVGILANLIPLKGHRDFLAMAAALTQEGLDAEYVVVGGDVHGTGYGDELKGLAASLGIGDRVTFTGHVGNIPTIVAGMDVFVCASHVEPFGICVLEAMAGSKPVVATRVGGIPEIVVPGETGYLVEPHRPDQLADRIRELAGHPDLRVRLGTTGRRRVEDEFSAGRQAARTLDLYEQALAAHRKRAGTAT
jgi:glycosyltransferase involved in cell wall biosynthesis